MEKLLGEEYPEFLSSYDQPRRNGLRVNRLKADPEQFASNAPFRVEPIPWADNGYYVDYRDQPARHPYYHAGMYYLQEPSAMAPAALLPVSPGDRILDLCAAPGGKTTDIAASLRERFGDRFTLLANEVMRSRYGILRSNVETWGDPRVGTVSRDPSAFGQTPLFDVIVADVPCSGEGMFRKDAQAVAEWSPATVEFCAARSRRILRDVWPALKPGGWLLYSTCTFNHLENDETVAWIARELGADILPPHDESPATGTGHGYLMLPGSVPGEGQYAAVVRKHGRPEGIRGANPFSLFRAEIPAPEWTGSRWNLSREEALRYLHGDALVLAPEAPVGPLTLCYENLPLGPAKNLGKRCNNLYPKAKRIRMDIR